MTTKPPGTRRALFRALGYLVAGTALAIACAPSENQKTARYPQPNADKIDAALLELERNIRSTNVDLVSAASGIGMETVGSTQRPGHRRAGLRHQLSVLSPGLS